MKKLLMQMIYASEFENVVFDLYDNKLERIRIDNGKINKIIKNPLEHVVKVEADDLIEFIFDKEDEFYANYNLQKQHLKSLESLGYFFNSKEHKETRDKISYWNTLMVRKAEEIFNCEIKKYT